MFEKFLGRKRRTSDLEHQSNNSQPRSSAHEQPMDKFIYKFSFDEPDPTPTNPSTTFTKPAPNPQTQPVPTISSSPSSEIDVLVDSRTTPPTTFTLPSSLLSQHCLVFRNLFSLSPAVRDLITRPPFSTYKGTLFLPRIYTSHFVDFARWLLRQSQSQSQDGSPGSRAILQLPHNNTPYALLASADRLISAIALGILLQSNSYQNAALCELHPLLLLLERPDLLIEPLFAATAGWRPPKPEVHMHPFSLVPRRLSSCGKGERSGKWEAVHPARRMVVGVLAERYGRRDVAYREVPGRSDAVREFWDLFYESRGRGLGNLETCLLAS